MASLVTARPVSSRLSKSLIVPTMLVVLAIVAMAAALAYLFDTAGFSDASATQTIYQTAQVTRGTITSTINATGPITPPASVPLTFKQGGRLAAISVEVGQRVEAGQELARLEAADLEAAVKQAQAALDEATAEHDRLANTPVRPAASSAESSRGTSVSDARSALQAAENDLENARTSAAQAVKAAQANVDSAQVKLEAAQRSLASAAVQAQTATTVDAVSLQSSHASFANAQDQYDRNIAASLVAFQVAQRDLEDARRSFEVTQQQVQHDAYADRVAVQNAEVDLNDARRDVEQVRSKADADLDLAVSQIYDAEADARTAEAQRRYDCRSSSTSSCSVARRNEDAARTSVATARRQVEVVRAQGRQAIVTAQGQVTKAESAVKTALATLRSNETKAAGTMTAAVAQVNDAQNALEIARAAVEKESASEQGTLIKSQSDVESAQALLNSNFAKNQGSLVEAQNDVDEAAATLDATRVTLAEAQATGATTVEKAQAQVTLATEEVNAATSDAEPAAPAPVPVEEADVNVAQDRVEGAKAALQTAQDSLKSATLVAPTAGIVSSINGAVGQQVSGGDTPDAASSGFITLTQVAMPNVTACVSGADVGRVEPGQKVMFSVDTLPGRTFTGTVTRIEPAAPGVANAVTHNVVSTVDPTDVVLLPTMNATVSIITERALNVTMVPNAALTFTAQRSTRPAQANRAADAGSAGRSALALVLADGQPIARQIRVGTSDENNTQVISGLEPGEQVIVGQVVTGPGQFSTQPK